MKKMKSSDLRQIIRESERKTKSKIDCGPSGVEIFLLSYSFDELPDNHPLVSDLLKRINRFFKEEKNA